MEHDDLPAAIEDYFRYLGENEFEKAGRQFTEDCVYHHSPSFHGSSAAAYEDVVVEGREELVEYFADVRGPKDIDHTLEKLVVSGNKVGLVGHQAGPDTHDDYFVSYAELRDDEIAYYMAGLLLGPAGAD